MTIRVAAGERGPDPRSRAIASPPRQPGRIAGRSGQHHLIGFQPVAIDAGAKTGAVPRTEIDVLRLRQPPAELRATLGLPKKASALYLGRRRFVDDELAGQIVVLDNQDRTVLQDRVSIVRLPDQALLFRRQFGNDLGNEQ